MARVALILVALASVFALTKSEEIEPQARSLENVAVDEQFVRGIPKVIESNLPTALNNIALSYSQKAMDNAGGLVAAAQRLQQQLTSYDRSQQWSVAIEPAAYYVTSYYFAHYLVNNYNVFLYTVNCSS